jgi:hypothetical protein
VTTASISEFPLSSGTLLAAIASVLLLFVSVGVIYLSAMEWRDKRRRKAMESRSGR